MGLGGVGLNAAEHGATNRAISGRVIRAAKRQLPSIDLKSSLTAGEQGVD